MQSFQGPCSSTMENSGHLPAKKSFTNGGNIYAALLNVLLHFIINTWNDVRVGIVKRSFRKVTYQMVSVEDKLLWQDAGEAEVEATPSDSESDPCDESLENTCMSHNVLNEFSSPC